MEIPLLYRQLEAQLRQWVLPKDKRHLQGYAEAVAAILQSARGVIKSDSQDAESPENSYIKPY